MPIRLATASALLVAIIGSANAAVSPPPLPHAMGRPPPHLSRAPDSALFRGAPGTASPWKPLAHPPPFNAGAMLQLTDGTIMVQDQGAQNNGTGNWWRLTPNALGSYVDGHWTQLASMPSNYAPLYYASATLPDGRVIVVGGEYNFGQEVWTNQGAIYDPLANGWTTVKPPTGSQWSRIGDAPGSVLANGRFMVGASGYSGTTAEALLNALTLRWKATGAGKADGNGEEAFTLLPNGDLLTVDTDNGTNTELYSPASGSWSSAGNTPVSLINDGEIGPAALRPDGTVLAVGATGANAVYDCKTGIWSAGPGFPVIDGGQYNEADGPAAVLPDRNVLLDASPGIYQTPSHFWVFNGRTLTQVADAPNAASQSSYDGFMMVLPTGQILFNDRIGDVSVYDAGGQPKPEWQPVIASVPSTLAAGSTYSITGRQLNGLTQGAAYGDDYQTATNFPLVRITLTASGHVYYARTAGMTAMSVKPGLTSSANFTLPAAIEAGAATLVVVANGIASAPASVTVTRS